MRFLFILLSMLLCSACSQEPKITDRLLTDLINEKLASQEVIIKAPGFPSKEEALVLVLEDPALPENQQKAYHPAEKLGWQHMLEYARAFEQAGALKVETGTFAERDYFDKNFTFTGHRLHITEPLKQDTVILPALGKVGFKLGKSCVGKILSHTEPKADGDGYAFTVTFEGGLCQLKSWATGEIVSLSGVNEVLKEPVTLRVTCRKQQCSIAEAKFLEKAQKPLLAL